MTKPELTYKRDLRFSLWVKKKLPDSSTGYLATDIDFMLYNYKTKKVMFLEIKTRLLEVENWQKGVYRDLNRWIRKGIDNDWIYLGFHKITFENTFFDDGKSFLDNKEISEEELIKFLSF